jgi:phage gp46-like protein
MVEISIRTDEACATPAQLTWDTVWDSKTGTGDWALAGASEKNNRGGLQAKAAIATAVELALFTDKRCPDDHPLRKFADQDPRGWWGDAVDVRDDLAEQELGSLLWLLERSVATEETARWARAFAIEALAPLKTQGVVASIDVQSEVVGKRLNLAVLLYARDGSVAYDRKYDILWQQVA